MMRRRLSATLQYYIINWILFTSSSPFIFRVCAYASVYLLRKMRYILTTFFFLPSNEHRHFAKISRGCFFYDEKHSMGNIITNSSHSYSSTVTLTVSISTIKHSYIHIPIKYFYCPHPRRVFLEIWNACSHFWLCIKQKFVAILKLSMLLKVCNTYFIQRFHDRNTAQRQDTIIHL